MEKKNKMKNANNSSLDPISSSSSMSVSSVTQNENSQDGSLMGAYGIKKEIPQIGQIYLVKRIDEKWLPAEILETRQNEIRGKRVEYFVHFENCKNPFQYLKKLKKKT